jgi:hypothetical protein
MDTVIEPLIRQAKQFPKGGDLKMVVGMTTIENLQFLELRDQYASGEYGKGYLVPAGLLGDLIEHLQWIQEYGSTAHARPGKGQQRMP